MTVRSFRHGALKRLYERDEERHIPPQFRQRIKAILAILDQADTVADLAAPGFRLHHLKGQPNYWSMRVSGNWRVVFRIKNSEIYNVDLEDYH